VDKGNTIGLTYSIKDPAGANKAVIGAQVFQAS